VFNRQKTENDILFCLHVYNGNVVRDEYSNLDSLAVVYGLILTSEQEGTMKNKDLLIYVDNYAAVGIINLDTGTERLYWGEDRILDNRSSILLYVLADHFEWLIYKSKDLKQEFHITAIPKKHPAHDGIIKRVDALEFYHAYKGMSDMMLEFNMLYPYKRLEEYFIILDEFKYGR
jgi:hypothetical protein